MKQKTFTFKYYKHEFYPKGTLAPDAFSLKDSLKNRLVRKGYLVKDLKEEEVISVRCTIAKANVPWKERQKLQNDIDNEKPTTPNYE